MNLTDTMTLLGHSAELVQHRTTPINVACSAAGGEDCWTLLDDCSSVDGQPLDIELSLCVSE